MNLTFQPPSVGEFPYLRSLPPAHWGFDCSRFVELHHNQKYFKALTARIDDQIVGFGNVIICPPSAWIGNLIVLPEFQRMGIGSDLFQRLLKMATEEKVSSTLLIATAEGKQLYADLGFITECKYLIFEPPQQASFYRYRAIQPIHPEDYNEVLKLDRNILREDRSAIIRNQLDTTFGYYYKGDLMGYFMPKMENGPIMALKPEYGQKLMRFRLGMLKKKIVIPENNKVAVKFCQSMKLRMTCMVDRMYVGQKSSWHPYLVYNRVAGYLG